VNNQKDILKMPVNVRSQYNNIISAQNISFFLSLVKEKARDLVGMILCTMYTDDSENTPRGKDLAAADI